MKFAADRPFADPEAAARKLIEIANATQSVQDGRIHIELVNLPFLRAEPFWELRAVVNSPDQDTLIRAVEDARRILGEYLEPGPRDAARTVHRLFAVLDRDEVLHALDRMKRRRTIRLVDLPTDPTRENPPA